MPTRALLVAQNAVASRGISARFPQHRESSTAGVLRLFLPEDFQTTSIVISSSCSWDFLFMASIRLLGRISVQFCSTQSRHSFFFSNIEGGTCGIHRLRDPDAGLGIRKLELLSGINWIHLRLQRQRTRAARAKRKTSYIASTKIRELIFFSPINGTARFFPQSGFHRRESETIAQH